MNKILLFYLMCHFINVQAQSTSRTYRKYGTQASIQRLSKLDRSYSLALQKMEKILDGSKYKCSNITFTVPIAFHILNSSVQTGPEMTQIIEQLNILNKSFSTISSSVTKHPALIKEKFEEKIALPNVTFCIALPDKKYTSTNSSIIRKISGKHRWSILDSMKYSIYGGDDAWDTESYLNIWITNLSDGYCGYAQLPGGSDNTDGIVIDTKYFGIAPDHSKNYNGGMTLVHLVANYLGVYDLWNELHYCADDNVDDTPIHNGQNYGVINDYGLVSTCDGQPIAMNMNFMDNSDDAQTFMFTNGQKARIQAVLSEPLLRNGLVKSKKTICEVSESLMVVESRKKSEPGTIELFPNPTNNYFSLQYSSLNSIRNIVAYSVSGVIVMNKAFNDEKQNGTIDIDTNSWGPGIYFIYIKTKEGGYTKKLIITK